MLHILFVILKILGILLASVLGLILLLLLIVLFVPIRYRIEGKRHEDMAIRIRIHWLLGIVRLYFHSINGKQQMILRIFGIPLMDSQRPKKEKKVRTKKKGKKNKKNKKNAVALSKDTSEQRITVEHDKESSKDDQVTDSVNHHEKDYEQEQSSQQKPHGKLYGILKKYKEFVDRVRRIMRKIKRIPEKLRGIKDKLLGILTSFTEKKNKIRDFWMDAINKLGMKGAFVELLNILKHCGPQKLSGKVLFGFEDPATTGQVLGIAAIIYARYGAKLDLKPDFEHAIFEIDVIAKGRIRIFSLLIICLRLIRNKEFKQFIKNVKRLKEEL